MHNNIHSVAPTTLYNHTKLELCTTPYPELALDRWMGQNYSFLSPKHTLFAQYLRQYKSTTKQTCW